MTFFYERVQIKVTWKELVFNLRLEDCNNLVVYTPLIQGQWKK